MSEERIREAAARLHKQIFGSQYDNGNIGMGSDRLFVYMYCRKNRWHGTTPEEFEGIPVEWRFGVRPRALAMTAPPAPAIDDGSGKDER